MSRIEALTPEQTARLSEWRDRWLKIGLSTEPADRRGAEAGVLAAYSEAGIPGPDIFIWLSSPMAGAIGAGMLSQVGDQVRDQVGDQVGGQVRGQVRGQVWDQVGDQVRDQVGGQVRGQVWDQVGGQVKGQVWDQVWDQVGGQVRGQVRGQVWDQVWDQVRGQVWDQVGGQVGGQVWDQVGGQVGGQVWDQVGGQVRGQVWDQVSRACYGLHDAGWLSFYHYFLEVCGLDSCKRLQGLIKTAESCGWWWPFKNAAIITERPITLKRDDRGRLHGETGPAISYSDGWGVYAWHGVRVNKQIIENPESITLGQIQDTMQPSVADPAGVGGNAEVRRVMIERYGLSRYLLESGAKKLHSDEFGEVYRTELLGDEPLVMVKVMNSTPEPDGSFKPYFLRIHPECRPMLFDGTVGNAQPITGRAAVASTFGMTADEYAEYLVQQT